MDGVTVTASEEDVERAQQEGIHEALGSQNYVSSMNAQNQIYDGLLKRWSDQGLVGSVGSGGTLFIATLGGSANSGVVFDTEDNACIYSEVCVLAGLGLYGDLSGTASVALSTEPLSEGTSYSLGGFLKGAWGPASGLSVSVGIDENAEASSFSGARGFLGTGGGGSAGFQGCRITITQCN